MTNAYSRTWFELFLSPISPAQTEREVAFLERVLPQQHFRRVLDLCCGAGRHARLLAARGYAVTGVDRDPAALEMARAADASSAYLERDMRDLSGLGPFDAALSLWQSFGYFDDEANEALLGSLAALLAPGGRLVLDVYHRDFFERHRGERRFTVGGLEVIERKAVRGGRLTVELDYGPGGCDRFEWRLYTPLELESLGRRFGLEPVLACAGFDPGQPASSEEPRMQLVLEQPAVLGA